METFDVVVIGAGPGGYPAAIRAAQLGASVAIVEKEQLGGTCLNWGCIPTKALIATADTFAHIKHAGNLGITVKGASVDYAVMIGHKNKVVSQLQSGVRQLLAANGVRQFTGVASFKDRNTITVSGSSSNGQAAEPKILVAKKVIIATGSTSVMPAFLPKHERVVESRGFLDLTRLPESMLVLGGGFIGCEFACMAAMLGVKVTIVELLEDILLLLDADLRREVRAHMEKSLGIRVLTGKALESIAANASGATGSFGDEVLKADLLLSAIGRKPVTDGLKPENAGVKITERGFIEADDYCRTNVPTIFAIGDVTGKIQLAHYATAQGIAAAENAVRAKPHKHDTAVPNVIFTSPEVGTVGLSEADARKQGRAVKTGKFRFAGLGRALAVGETTGFVKWIADAATGQLLGAAAVGPHATELIAEATAAIRAELTAHEHGRTIHAHPTFSEAWMEAAHAVHGEAIHAPPIRKPSVP
ncbi:MAG TPA: dihydrolipoyl dehydrogenase [Candidatus Paceibacterota bacterium]|nr:dihydrolipoyl dehydrogenase [Verrucomicrobiota bacterium]HSA10695.1 dihydrolipoyl dehydrogenase [Candidatus Paceibacterota bacterium]